MKAEISELLKLQQVLKLLSTILRKQLYFQPSIRFAERIARLSLHQLVTDGRIHPARIEEVVAKTRKQIEEEIIEVGKRTTIDLGIHGLHPELIRLIGKMKYRSSYGQNLLQHSREVANL